jgi:hypothetical protein
MLLFEIQVVLESYALFSMPYFQRDVIRPDRIMI